MAKAKKEHADGVLIKHNAAGMETVVASIRKEFGEESVTAFDEKFMERKHAFQIASGSIGLDMAIGPMRKLPDGRWLTGFVPGRIIEIIGPESSGKTTLCLHLIANVQQLGGVAAFIDAEHAFDPKYATQLGVNLRENFLFTQPDSGEQALTIVEKYVRSRAVNLIVVDSTAALIPKSELEGDMGDAQMGSQARLMSQAMRKIVSALGQNCNCVVVFINQIRMKVGVMFGNPETTPGGNAVKFYSSVRIDVRKTQTNKSNDVATSNRTRVKVIKNKIAPPFREAEFNINFGEGVDIFGELIEWGVNYGVIEKSGAWYNYHTVRLGNGLAAATAFLKGNRGTCYQIYDQILTRHMENNGFSPDGKYLPNYVPPVQQAVTKVFDPKATDSVPPEQLPDDLVDEGGEPGEEGHG